MVCLTQFGACVYGSVQDNTQVLSEPVTQWEFFVCFFSFGKEAEGWSVECSRSVVEIASGKDKVGPELEDAWPATLFPFCCVGAFWI